MDWGDDEEEGMMEEWSGTEGEQDEMERRAQWMEEVELAEAAAAEESIARSADEGGGQDERTEAEPRGRAAEEAPTYAEDLPEGFVDMVRAHPVLRMFLRSRAFEYGRSTASNSGATVDMEPAERRRIDAGKNWELLRMVLWLHEQHGFTVVYAVDGSKQEAAEGAHCVGEAATAWGAWDGLEVLGGAMHADATTFRSELRAIAEVLGRASAGMEADESGRAAKVLVLSDCRPSLQAIQGTLEAGAYGHLRAQSGGLLIEEVVRHVLRIEEGGGEVVFMYVPAHSGGIAANGYADAIAKSHLSEPAGKEAALTRVRMAVYYGVADGAIVDEPLFRAARRARAAHVVSESRSRVEASKLAAAGVWEGGEWGYVMREAATRGGDAGANGGLSGTGMVMALRAAELGLPASEAAQQEEPLCPLCDGRSAADMLHVITCECGHFSEERRQEHREAMAATLRGAAAAVPTGTGAGDSDDLTGWKRARRDTPGIRQAPAAGAGLL